MDVQKALAMKQIGLTFHMEAEMKSLPQENRTVLMTVFTKYWNKEVALHELQEQLREKAVGTLARSFKEEQELTASLAQNPVDADLGESLFQNKLNSGR